MSPPTASALTPLSDAERERLAHYLAAIGNPDTLTLEGMDGLFCALIAGPDLILPSEYLPVVWGGDLPNHSAFTDLAQVNVFLQLITRHWNCIIAELESDGFYEPLFDCADARGLEGRLWARGFMRGVSMRKASWATLLADENEAQLLTIPLVAGTVDPDFPSKALSPEDSKPLLIRMGAGLARAYRHFTSRRRTATRSAHEGDPYRRSVAKVGRNEPCPCGSGRKFKHCCGLSTDPATH
jgi:uncharacterized protein